MIPPFNSDGYLPPGIFECTGDDFLSRFCTGEVRDRFSWSVINIFDYAASHGANSVLIGGSFVTKDPNPHDIDCVIVFKTADQIPQFIQNVTVRGNTLDIIFASEDQPVLLSCCKKLFTTSRFKTNVGAISIIIHDSGKVKWDIYEDPDEHSYEIVRRVYGDRHHVEQTPKVKAIVTIHGIRTHADWNSEISLLASSNGWIVAPFQYGYVGPTIFLNGRKRSKIIDQFRDHLADLYGTFGLNAVSVIAHSLGTYIALKYITDISNPPTKFDTLVLCGAIVDCDLDLRKLEGKVSFILNERAPNDFWAKWARPANFWRDKMFGYAGTQGFSENVEFLEQRTSKLFNHNNVIKRDIVRKNWMPILEANRTRYDSDELIVNTERMGMRFQTDLEKDS
jgi:pimeloyl-ACP methyl ester carboxylesterase